MAPPFTRDGASVEAIELVYRARLPEFRRVAAAITGDRELALDAVQDGFATALRKRKDYRGDGPIEAWIWRTVLNATLSQRRRRRRVVPLVEGGTSRENGHAGAEADRVRAALLLIPERQRLVVFLHYYADLDYAAIADVLEIRTGTVGATLHSARAAMRRLLKEVAP
jgi:RNA polymerase sigma-70 factor (ECF subfamily)